MEEAQYDNQATQEPLENNGENKDEQTQEMRVLIDNYQVGGIIGKAGANVQRVREESGAFVSILKAESRTVPDRVLVLKGASSQIATATQLIAELLQNVNALKEQKKEVSDSATVAIRYLVHKTAIGAIIGKGGAVIQETQSATGVRIQISNEPLPGSSEKTVSLTGNPKSIQEAALRVLTQLRDNPLRAGTKVYPYIPGQQVFQQPFGLPAANPYTPAGVQPALYGQPSLLPYGAPPPVQGTSTQKIAIPTICAGCVIGKKGSVIRDLRLQSGCSISIADPEQSNPNERVVTLAGTPQGIQTAVYLIRHLVEQYQPQQQVY